MNFEGMVRWRRGAVGGSPATLLVLIFIACATKLALAQSDSSKPSESAHGLEELIRRYSTDLHSVTRFYDLPWSATRFDRLENLYREWQQRLRGVDFDALDQQGRIDYLLLRNELKSSLADRALDRRRLAEMEELLPFREKLQKLEQARRRFEPLDPQTSASEVTALAEQIKKVRKRVEKDKKDKKEEKASTETPNDKEKKEAEKGPPIKVSPLLARRTAAVLSDLRGTLKTWFSFYDGYQPDFSWWVKKPQEDASSALDDYAKYLREEIAGLKGKDEDPLIGDPIGAEALADALATEMIPYNAEQIIAIGEKEFAWCEARMKEAAREMGFGDDWKAALAKVKTQFVPPGKQDEFVVEQARQAIQFVKDRDLVTLPPLCEELWRVSMISPEGQKTTPYAAYGGQNVMVAYAREDMKHEDKLMSMRGNNRHFTRLTIAHELIPGHHLERFMSARHRDYRAIFETPFMVEGWPLYWELRLWDLGYAQSPEDRVGMLFWRMHRGARIIVSLKFHLGKMKPAEMVDFLVDRVGHERLGATSEVRRFIGGEYSPLYQCAYMIGGLQLRALHQELVGAGKMTEKQFHDTVLTYHSIPVELVRAGMLGVPLTRETPATWKFAGENPAAN